MLILGVWGEETLGRVRGEERDETMEERISTSGEAGSPQGDCLEVTRAGTDPRRSLPFWI